MRWVLSGAFEPGGEGTPTFCRMKVSRERVLSSSVAQHGSTKVRDAVADAGDILIDGVSGPVAVGFREAEPG